MEFLAATWMVNRIEVIPTSLEHINDDWWENVVLLAGAHPKLAENFRSELINQILDQVDIIIDPDLKTSWLVMAGNLAADMAETLPGPDHERVEEVLLAWMTGPGLNAKLRVTIGNTLARLDDPRDGVMTARSNAVLFHTRKPLPDGRDKPRIVDQPAFWLSRHPVTNSQFDAFIAARVCPTALLD